MVGIILSLIIVIIFGYIGGFIFNKIKLPKIIGMIIIGVILGVCNILTEQFLNYADILRKIALVIVLTKAGLSIEFSKIKECGLSAVLMCFIPAVFEIIGVLIFAPLIFNIDYLEALLLGSVLAAVSPAIIVPRMIKYKDLYQSNAPDVILSGASLDDIFVILVFYSVLSFFNDETLSTILINFPISITIGVVVGLIIGIIYKIIFNKINNAKIITIIIFITSIILITVEYLLKDHIPFQSLISIIIAPTFLISNSNINEIKKQYNKLWFVFEIILFVLVGVALDVTVVADFGFKPILLIIIALLFRIVGVFICTIKFEFKEKLFCIIAYLPKATVQASIGAIALSNNLACGQLVLVVAVVSILITAPLGAILLDTKTSKLLS